MICLFCFRSPGAAPWCPDNPGEGCTYGLRHEYATPRAAAILAEPAALKRVHPQLCKRCGLHPKNPKSATNGCEHLYELLH